MTENYETAFSEYEDLEVNPILLLIENLETEKWNLLYSKYKMIREYSRQGLLFFNQDDNILFPIILLIKNLSDKNYNWLYRLLINCKED